MIPSLTEFSILESVFALNAAGVFWSVLIIALIATMAIWKIRSNEYLARFRTSQRDLMSGGENLRRIFESIQDYAIFTYNRDHIITSWNPGVERVLGYNQDEFIGKSIEMIFDETDRAEGIAEMEILRALSEGYSVTEGIRIRKTGPEILGQRDRAAAHERKRRSGRLHKSIAGFDGAPGTRRIARRSKAVRRGSQSS